VEEKMNPIEFAAAGFPMAIFLLVLISFYKVFVKKKSVTPFYTPFDQITGQTGIEFHEEQEILAEDEDLGNDKDRKLK
jgi:hypothetical protein